MIICLLGRQPALGLAELEATFGATMVTDLGSGVAGVETKDFAMSRFGGVVKAAHELDRIETTDFAQLLDRCRQLLPPLISAMPAGKVKLGLSLYGQHVTPQKINAAALDLKKTVKRSGHSVRVVPNNDMALSSAQVLHNQLTSSLGIEILFISVGRQTIIARTFAEQNIDDYTLRDRGRPKRDARVGMLPPKLAQIMLHLAVPGNQTEMTILDPFCGTGVVLQEAALLGYTPYGSDLSQRMIDYTEANLQWLRRTYDLSFDSTLETADARTHRWQQPFHAVVCETYLGEPLLAPPSPEKMQHIMAECDDLHRAFLKNLATQTQPNIRLCLAIPAWHTKSGFRHLPVLDDLENLGYNRLDFKHASREHLIYHREDQFVARELVVVTRK